MEIESWNLGDWVEQKPIHNDMFTIYFDHNRLLEGVMGEGGGGITTTTTTRTTTNYNNDNIDDPKDSIRFKRKLLSEIAWIKSANTNYNMSKFTLAVNPYSQCRLNRITFYIRYLYIMVLCVHFAYGKKNHVCFYLWLVFITVFFKAFYVFFRTFSPSLLGIVSFYLFLFHFDSIGVVVVVVVA